MGGGGWGGIFINRSYIRARGAEPAYCVCWTNRRNCKMSGGPGNFSQLILSYTHAERMRRMGLERPSVEPRFERNRVSKFPIYPLTRTLYSVSSSSSSSFLLTLSKLLHLFFAAVCRRFSQIDEDSFVYARVLSLLERHVALVEPSQRFFWEFTVKVVASWLRICLLNCCVLLTD